MRTIRIVLVFATVCAGLAMADSWSGTLKDAVCYQQEKGAKPCDVTGSTATFVLDVSGKIYQLDSEGNTKVIAAMKNRADRSADPSKAHPAPVVAKVTGTAEGQIIKVEAVEIR